MEERPEEEPKLYRGQARRIIQEIRQDELIRPVRGEVIYDPAIAEEWPDFPLQEFLDILTANLFDWPGSTEEFLQDIPMSEADITQQEREKILKAGQLQLFGRRF